MSVQPLRVGVVGLGIGRSHLEAFGSLPDLFDVVAVCDLDASRAEAVAEQFGVPAIAADFDALCR
ncbi:MAG: Gfo/Idh/MocA family oxidoreductase, partial [Anaerolineae bacterium]|nr:Gfo/Idh/MocA family oxidoreductase [Anaerolineae bacterium]